jgi:hypothetical protein
MGKVVKPDGCRICRQNSGAAIDPDSMISSGGSNGRRAERSLEER